MFQKIAFSIMNRDKKLYDIEVLGFDVKVTDYTTEFIDKQFPPGEVTVDVIFDWFEERCVPRTRKNIEEALSYYGLKEYDPYDICKVTHGTLHGDFTWIKWEGEDITYEDVKIPYQ